MGSMRAPLGRIDTRLRMSDTPADEPVTSSFPSIVAFEDLLQRDQRPLNYMGTSQPKMDPRVQFASETSHNPIHGRGIGKPYPRLELDVALDKYHSLDGFTEPVSPRNTPASISCCESPEDSARPVETQNMRTSSAPQIQSLAFEWFDGKSEGDLMHFDGNSESKAQKRRFSADYEHRSSTILPPKDLTQTTGTASSEKPEDNSPHMPCVRSSPPPTPSPKSRSPPADRPIPTVERKADYIAAHGQQKHYKKWKGSNRALAQRVSPYRSPPKAPKIRPLNRQSDVPFSSLLPSSGRQEGSRDLASQTDPSQETVEHNIPADEKNVATGATDARVDESTDPSSDLVGLSFSIYRVQHPQQHSVLGLGGSAFQVEMTSTPFPFHVSDREEEEAEHTVNRPSFEDLVFHHYVVLPAVVARFPVAVFSILNRACNSRIGTILLYLEKMFWSIVIAFFLAFLAKFRRRPGSGPGAGHGH
ncbi:uncharacterized protein N7496_009496 [Penicillium cataractarum]|uniref:Uncharacterized protein n=1 Tax=Penicillium cataractarum TaxID=2100454 RepID=A0A9W9RP36_9EURO|nr:uncharacterized protein N7496_009496 [Penicillium cataractarum]KAJ5363783.1 hypothetical protein N7496_009496 [Penicillium cataractarum]